MGILHAAEVVREVRVVWVVGVTNRVRSLISQIDRKDAPGIFDQQTNLVDGRPGLLI